ncbi:hypothetical protein [Micromonospora sp. RTGN7]|uniref:hypothetical protein n=1 Tax=Micromonospora sp. RTGN7 TaxID=3016526 RepID=UPI0029FED4A2|nr:hypothetical protein [Micromonospora sp. RTGN7]
MRQEGPARRDWRDVVADAADLALVGFLLVAGALPVLTAGAALAAASAAVHDRVTNGGWPDLRTTLRRYVRALPAGVPVTLTGLAGAVLLGADLAALATGRVPGGAPALLVTGVVAAALAGYAGLVVVEVGRAGGRGWRAAARAAARACLARPVGWAAASGVCCLVGVLTALVIPVALPILAGYALAALHAVARRRPAVAVEPS